MRKIINSTFITVDGIIQNPQDSPEFGVEDESSYQIQRDLLFSCDQLIMGRAIYESFAAAWSARSGDEYTDRINSMEKYVVSTTLKNPTWNNTRGISENLLDTIRRLKSSKGKDIIQYGFGRLSFALMEEGLVDELRLWIHPFFLGSGTPQDLLFRPCSVRKLDVSGTKVLKNGVVILYYRFK